MWLRFKKPAVNIWRGEVCVIINGKWEILRLDFDALARLESLIEDQTLMHFLDRISDTGMRVSDIEHVLRVALPDNCLCSAKGGVNVDGGFLIARKAAMDLLQAALELSTDEPRKSDHA